jgi:hypothetical protein
VTVFVSRHAKHNHEIWSGNQEYMNVNGSPKMVTKMPALSVQFEPRRLTELQRRTAAQAFGMIPYGRDLIMLPNSVDAGHPDDGWRPGYSAEAAATAYPRAHDDVVIGVSGEAVATTGYDPQFNLGSYDTGSDHNDQSGMIPYQSVGARSEKERKAVWDEVEAVLRASPDFGRSIIAIDEQTIPPPFPGYVKVKGDTAAAVESMRMTCDAAGFNYGPILEYERAVKQRPNMMAMMEARYAEQLDLAKQQADVRSGLEVTVQ